MGIPVGINGFGRIGRIALRIMLERGEKFELRGINLRKADLDYMEYMVKYDSVFRTFHGTVEHDGENLIVNGHKICVFSQSDAGEIPWSDCGAEYIIESTGAFNTQELGSLHFKGGAKKVVITAPAKDNVTPTFVMGVNDARRKQPYFSLNHGSISLPDEDAAERRWIEMDIDYPEHIVERVNAALAEHGERDGVSYVVDVAGHGAAKYASVWQGLRALGSVVDGSVLDAGKAGLAVFATTALSCELRGDQVVPIEPLYLRRPDAEVPNPLKHVLGHAGADKA